MFCPLGRHFSHSTEHDICIHSKLELRLPAAVDDLIPPNTVISTAPAAISRDGTVAFDTTLAYLISAKLLHRLRAHNAEITLNVDTVDVDAVQKRLGAVQLCVSDAKMVVHHGGPMDQVSRFVADRGSWQTLDGGRKEQIKAGLFVVAMPAEQKAAAAAAVLGDAKRRASSSFLSSASGNFELKSLDLMTTSTSSNNTPLLFSDSTTTTTTSTTASLLSSPSSASFLKKHRASMERYTAPRSTATLQRQKQLQKAIKKTQQKKQQEQLEKEAGDEEQQKQVAVEEDEGRRRRLRELLLRPPDGLRRARSHAELSKLAKMKLSSSSPEPLPPPLPARASAEEPSPRRREYVDLNLDQLSAEFQRIKIFGDKTPARSRPSTRKSLSRSSTHSSFATSPSFTTDSVPRYHQIGKGTSPYTFYFNIVHADNLRHLLLRSFVSSKHRRGVSRRPYFSYTFLSTRVSCPASSIKATTTDAKWPTCFHLRGHLVDIQQWLDDQEFLEVSLILANDDERILFSKETVGIAHVPLNHLAFYRPGDQCYYDDHKRRSTCLLQRNLIERTFPVYDVGRLRSEEVAKVTVRLGLVSGWWQAGDDEDEEEEKEADKEKKRTLATKRPISHELYEWFKKKKSRNLETTTSGTTKLRNAS